MVNVVIPNEERNLGSNYQYGGDPSLSATGGSACGMTFRMTTVAAFGGLIPIGLKRRSGGNIERRIII